MGSGRGGGWLRRVLSSGLGPFARGVPLAALVVVTCALVGRKLATRVPVATSLTAASAGQAAPGSSLGAARWAPSAPLADATVPARSATTFHGEAQRRHRAHGKGPRRVSVGFAVNLGGPVAAQVVTSPDGSTLYAATLAGQLVALSLAGEKKWSFSLGERAYGAPSVGPDGTVYVGSDQKKVYAVSPAGKLVYALDVGGEADAAPLLTPDGQLIVPAGDTVYALTAGGDVAHRFRARKKVYSAPSWSPDGRIAFGAQDHRLYLLGPAFALEHAIDLGADVDCAAAALDDGAFIVGTDAGEVVRVERDGSVAWRTKVSGYVRGGVTIGRSGDIVVGTFGPVPRIVRLSQKGEPLGAFELQGTGARDFGVWGSPLEDDELSLYFGTQDDRVLGLDARGALIFSYATGGDVDAPITMLADGSLIVGSEDGFVTRLLP